MGEIGASSRVIDERRGDFNGKIEEQPPYPGKRDGIAPEQRGKPARRVHRRARHVSRTNNSPVANRASWLPARDGKHDLAENALHPQTPGSWIFLPSTRKLMPSASGCPRALAFAHEVLLILLP